MILTHLLGIPSVAKSSFSVTMVALAWMDFVIALIVPVVW
jgi:hypothetical protein